MHYGIVYSNTIKIIFYKHINTALVTVTSLRRLVILRFKYLARCGFSNTSQKGVGLAAHQFLPEKWQQLLVNSNIRAWYGHDPSCTRHNLKQLELLCKESYMT